MIFRHLLNMRSHPTWVRGLKLHVVSQEQTSATSHPTWVRGLKLLPATGAYRFCCRTLRGCVD